MGPFAVVVRAQVVVAHAVDVDAIGPDIEVLGPVDEGGLDKRGESRVAGELVVDQLLVREAALVRIGLRVEGPVGVPRVTTRAHVDDLQVGEVGVQITTNVTQVVAEVEVPGTEGPAGAAVGLQEPDDLHLLRGHPARGQLLRDDVDPVVRGGTDHVLDGNPAVRAVDEVHLGSLERVGVDHRDQGVGLPVRVAHPAREPDDLSAGAGVPGRVEGDDGVRGVHDVGEVRRRASVRTRVQHAVLPEILVARTHVDQGREADRGSAAVGCKNDINENAKNKHKSLHLKRGGSVFGSRVGRFIILG